MTELKIYQISSDRDENRVAFVSLEDLKKYQDSPNPDPSVYSQVFEGSVDCGSLEEVYEKFNLSLPANFSGHALSVSDIVQVENSDSVKPGFYFCDSVGFSEVPFDTEKAQEKDPTIRVVLLEPGKLARTADIGTSLESLQNTVGGMIETYYPFDEQVCIICNEEGKLNGMKLNRAVRGEDNQILDIIAGPCFLCDCTTENFRSLSDEQLKRYTQKFKYPENFFRINGEIHAIPFKPMTKDQER